MKKETIGSFISVVGSIIIVIVLLGFIKIHSNQVTNISETKETPLIQISEDTSLYYYNNTKVIYILLKEDDSDDFGYGYMSPYYSENGKLCRYIDGKIEEIN